MAYKIRFVDHFSEPEFTNISSLVFQELEDRSNELSSIRQEETALQTQAGLIVEKQRMLRCGAFKDGALVGWSHGFFVSNNTFYMANSGVLPPCRRAGVYTRLVEAILEKTKSMGVSIIRSRHVCYNNSVIIAKLKLGFHITGLEYSEEYGPLVCLTYFHGERRSQLFKQRTRALG